MHKKSEPRLGNKRMNERVGRARVIATRLLPVRVAVFFPVSFLFTMRSVSSERRKLSEVAFMLLGALNSVSTRTYTPAFRRNTIPDARELFTQPCDFAGGCCMTLRPAGATDARRRTAVRTMR